jgi:hypothetical protein
MWVLYPVAKDSFVPVFSVFGIDPSNALLATFGVISTTTASSLALVATASSSVKFYHALSSLFSSIRNCCKSRSDQNPQVNNTSNIEWKRPLVALLATVLAICNATVQVEVVFEYLDIDQTFSKFELVASAIGSFSVCFWAVDEVILKYLKSRNVKASLLSKISKIKQNLSGMSTPSLKGLRNLLGKFGCASASKV